MIRSAFALILVVALSASNSQASSKDDTRLGDSPWLSYLLTALHNPGNMTALELVQRAGGVYLWSGLPYYRPLDWVWAYTYPKEHLIDFDEAPNPTQLFSNSYNSNEPISTPIPLKPIDLKILSYNVAYLELIGISGKFGYGSSPHLEERKKQLHNHIFDKGYDVIFLQEYWGIEVIDFELQAIAEGYTLYMGTREPYDDGLITLVRTTLVEESTLVQRHTQTYAAQAAIFEYFNGVQYGFMAITLNHPQLGTLRLYNTHLSPLNAGWRLRMQQARQLGLHLFDHKSPNAVAILGGDLNASPYYAQDKWVGPKGAVDKNYFHNALMYALLSHYGEMYDALVMGRDPKDIYKEIEIGNKIKNWPEVATKRSLFPADWCINLGDKWLTAQDCNTLHFDQYKGLECPARLDYIMLQDPDNRVYVQKSKLVFTSPLVRLKDKWVELSDHYGVEIEISIRPMSL